ncbi:MULTISPECIES: hypothetical protein [Pseudomonas]|uniref:Uncharacterized protein n=1 Tax=Pseudomonas aphyarum TaxID=2942629 RepID=A0ABT5PKR6_9PSED|nr:hypothetical protein [Pseudomonas aphyarum]MDD0968584.1 hypothetical protein [Pseudomonas aphyarum]MDD1124484.1 hypothetical protein [Pseudomonas aphyarum]
MSQLISEIRTKWEFDDGVLFEDFVSWTGTSTSFDDLKKYALYAQEHIVVRFERYLVLENGVEIRLHVSEMPYLLEDRTGVLVVFNEEPSKFSTPEFPWFFNCPDNAAIYNADGSLRFQLQNSSGIGNYIGIAHHTEIPGNPNALGVLVGTLEHDPEWLYLVDPDSPKLIPTGKWIRY